eukprot:5788272-Pyramimonas_sp.AAC.1
MLMLGGRPGKWGAVYPEREDVDGTIITTDEQLCLARLKYFASVEQARVQQPMELLQRYNETARQIRPPCEIPVNLVQSHHGLAYSFSKAKLRKAAGPDMIANDALRACCRSMARLWHP